MGDKPDLDFVSQGFALFPMKRLSTLSVSFPLPERARWTQVAADYCNSLEWHEPFNASGRLALTCIFDMADPKYSQFVALLTKNGLDYMERLELSYSDEDLRSFKFLGLSVERARLDGGGPLHGTEFDMSSACPKCGTGAVQTSPLKLPLKGFPKKGQVCQAAYGEFLINPEVERAIRDAGFTGVELRQVQLYGNNEPLPWWQVITNWELPRMSARTRGVILSEHKLERPCGVCHRDGRFHTMASPLEMVYALDDVNPDDAPDFVHTWECFGKSAINKEKPKFSSFAQPLLLVKPAVYQVFRDLGVKSVRFDAVNFV